MCKVGQWKTLLSKQLRCSHRIAFLFPVPRRPMGFRRKKNLRWEEGCRDRTARLSGGDLKSSLGRKSKKACLSFFMTGSLLASAVFIRTPSSRYASGQDEVGRGFGGRVRVGMSGRRIVVFFFVLHTLRSIERLSRKT